MTIVTTQVYFYSGKASLHHNSFSPCIMSAPSSLGPNSLRQYYPSTVSNASSTASLLPPSQSEMPRGQFSNRQLSPNGSLQPSLARPHALRASPSSNSLVCTRSATKLSVYLLTALTG